MKINNFFKDLFVLDLANNHFGDLNHAIKIINQFAKIIKKHKIKSSIKFQFRDLNTFVHKNYIDSNQKYVRRFLDTRLEDGEFKKLVNFIKRKKILASCTPFDENSVSKIEKMKFDIIKIASVSAIDFNLHERVAKNNIPKIISTGGVQISDIDKIVSFYKKKEQNFALMHCISIYPTENDNLQISYIKNLIKRYGDVPIGWSTHENPEDFRPSTLAYSCGANIIEKHIGIDSKKYKLNNYSITPKIFDQWCSNFLETKKMLGNENNKIINQIEKKTLYSLQRGVYAKKNINKNEKLELNKNIYFAFPLQKGQLASSNLKKHTISAKKIKKDNVLKLNDISYNKELVKEYKLRSFVHKAKALLNYANIKMSENFDMEISHHKGIDNFEKIGCFLFNIINKEYAKKLIVMLPNQKHPLHFHKKKAESFIISYGTLTLFDNKKKYKLIPGDVIHLRKSSWHRFTAGNKGCIFEEISTTSLSDDSFYYQKKIKNLKRDNRKTFVNNWYSLNKKKIVQ